MRSTNVKDPTYKSYSKELKTYIIFKKHRQSYLPFRLPFPYGLYVDLENSALGKTALSFREEIFLSLFFHKYLYREPNFAIWFSISFVLACWEPCRNHEGESENLKKYWESGTAYVVLFRTLSTYWCFIYEKFWANQKKEKITTHNAKYHTISCCSAINSLQRHSSISVSTIVFHSGCSSKIARFICDDRVQPPRNLATSEEGFRWTGGPEGPPQHTKGPLKGRRRGL